MNRWRRIPGYVGAAAVLLAGWWVVSAIIASPALPSPELAIADFVRLWRSELWPQLLVSAWRVGISMLIALVIAAPLGLLIGRARRLDALAAPLIYLSYPIPKIVLLPVLLVLFGIGDAPKIALITLILFFQMLVTARDAARNIPDGPLLSMRSLGATRGQIFRHVVVPAALPDLFTALRVSSGTAIAVLFFSESVAGVSGLGYYIMDAWSRIAYSEMFAGIIAMALLGVVIYELLDAAEARLCRWTRAGR